MNPVNGVYKPASKVCRQKQETQDEKLKEIMDDLYHQRKLYFEQSMIQREKIRQKKEEELQQKRKQREEKYRSHGWTERRFGRLRISSAPSVISESSKKNSPLLTPNKNVENVRKEVAANDKAPIFLPPIHRIKSGFRRSPERRKKSPEEKDVFREICKSRYLRLTKSQIADYVDKEPIITLT